MGPRRSLRLIESPIGNMCEVSAHDGHSDSDDDENTEEAEPRQTSKRQAVASSHAKEGDPSLKQKRRATRKVEPDEQVDPEDLVGRVLRSPQSYVKELLGQYKTEPGAVVTTLLNILAQFSGWTESWTEAEWEERGVEQLAANLDASNKAGGVDHFKDKGHSSKEVGAGAKAKRKLMDFFTQLAWEADSAGLDVLALLQDACDFCTLLSGSAFFTCRITAVAAATAMMTAFVDLINKHEKARDRAQRQLKTATDKEGKSKSAAKSSRIESLEASVDKIHQSITALKDKLTAVWEAIMNERFRDVLPSIRLNVIHGISYWTAALPSYVLHDKYLKYLAWAMSDVDAGVRVAALQGMQTLYSSADNIPLLKGFTDRFHQRIKEIVMDVNPEVAVASLHLQATMLEQGLLKLDDLAHATRALAHPAVKVCEAAADLLKLALEADADDDSVDLAAAGPSKGRGKAKKGAEDFAELQRLCELFHLVAAETPSAAPKPLSHAVMACIVEHLSGRLEVLSDWGTLCSALNPEALAGVSPADATNLVTLANCCIERAVRGEEREGPSSKRRAKDSGSARQEITLILMDCLPNMLREFSADPATVMEVVGLIPLMDTEMYVLKRQQGSFKALMEQVVSLFQRLSEEEPLDACVWALQQCLSTTQDALKDSTQRTLDKCIQHCISAFDAAAASLSTCQDADLKPGNMALMSPNKEQRRAAIKRLDASDATFAIATSTVRVKHLLLAFPEQVSADERVWNSISDILEACVQGRPLPSQVCHHATSAAFMVIVVDLERLSKQVDKGEAVSQLDFNKLKGRISLLESKAEALLKHQDREVRDSAARCLTDMLCVLGDGDAAKEAPPTLKPVLLTPSLELVNALWEHCEGLLDTLAEAMSATADAEAGVAAAGDGGEPEEAAKEALAEAGEREQQAREHALQAVQRIVRLVVCNRVKAHSRMLGSHVLAHTPLLGDAMFALVQAFIRRMRKDFPASLPGMVVDALKVIFDELIQVDNSRYGLDDFSDIARLLSQPLSIYGTPPAMAASIWAAGLNYFDESPTDHHEFLTHGLMHFIDMLSPAHARTYADQLSDQQHAVADTDALQAFMDKLESRAHKAAAKPALKKKGGGTLKRRITFHEDVPTPPPPAKAATAANAVALLSPVDRIEDAEPGPSGRHAAGDDEIVDVDDADWLVDPAPGPRSGAVSHTAAADTDITQSQVPGTPRSAKDNDSQPVPSTDSLAASESDEDLPVREPPPKSRATTATARGRRGTTASPINSLMASEQNNDAGEADGDADTQAQPFKSQTLGTQGWNALSDEPRSYLDDVEVQEEEPHEDISMHVEPEHEQSDAGVEVAAQRGAPEHGDAVEGIEDDDDEEEPEARQRPRLRRR